MSKMPNSPSLKKNFVVYLLRTLLSTLSPLVVFPYVSRVLGVDGVGRVQYAQSIAMYFELAAGLGLLTYAVREGAKVRDDRAKLEKLITELLTINLIAMGISLLVYCATVFSLPSLAPYRMLLTLFALEVVFGGVNFEWFYNILEDYTYISVRTILFQLFSFVVLFLFVRTPGDVDWYAIVLLIPLVFTSVTNLLHSRHTVRLFRCPSLNLSRHLKPIFFVFSVTVSSSVYTMLDTTMLGAMMGDTAVGLYTAASKLNRMGVKLITAVCAVFLPRLALYRAQNDSTSFRRLASAASNIILSLSFPCCLGLWLLAPQVITLFSGPQFLDAVPAMRMMTVDLLIASLNGFFAWQILMPYNGEKVVFAATLAGGVLDFVLNAWMIPLWGVQSAAAATVIAELLVCAICLWRSRQYVSMASVWRYTWQYLLACTPFFPLCFLADHLAEGAFAVTMLSVALCAPIYGILLLVLRNPFAWACVREVFSLIRRLVRRPAKGGK